MNVHKPLQLKRSLPAAIGVALLSLAQFVPLIVPGADARILTTPPENNCLTQAKAQINKVRYLGKHSSGDDQVAVEWLVHSVSECVPFGSGEDSGKVNVTPFGYELTVKIKRRLGNEDSAKVTKREIVSGTTTTVVRIPRANLETDPVSFTATLKTTAGSVQTFNRVVTGTGVPSLVGATQSTNKHSTFADQTSCFSSADITAVNFIPGGGATPDNVTVNWSANTPASPCFEQPRFKLLVRLRRANGTIDTSQTVFSPGSITATLQLPGAPGGVTNFSVVLTVITGDVVEKTSTQSGNFV